MHLHKMTPDDSNRFWQLDTDYDLITGLYDIGCPALHTVFTYPVRLKFGTADLPFCETESGA